MRAALFFCLVIWGVLLFALRAFAHDEIQEHCVPIPSPATEWKQLHDEYWESVAVLREVGHQYRECVAGINEHRRIRGEALIVGAVGITGYKVPLHELESRPNEVDFARVSVEAANATIAQHAGHLVACHNTLDNERAFANAHWSLYRRLWNLFLRLPVKYQERL